MSLRRLLAGTTFVLAVVFLAVVVPGTTGCNGFFIPVCQAQGNCGGGGGTYSSYAYVANATISTIEGFPIPTATFSTLKGTSYSQTSAPSALAATPKGTFLYVASSTSGGVLVYSIGTNGALTVGNGGNAVTSTLFPSWMTVDPSGNWLFLLSSTLPQVSVFQINTSTGVLTPASQGPVALSGGNPTQVFVTPNNQYVYIGLKSGGVDGFTLNTSTGALTNKVHLAPLNSLGAADNAISGDKNSAYLIVGETVSGIRVLKINSGGGLTEVSGSPFATQLGPSSILVDPSNTYVYVANNGANAITGYTLGSDGTLTPLSSSPFSTGTGPNALSLDSTGKYVFVTCNGGSPDLQVFSFDTTTGGKLDSVVSTATGTDPTGPISLAVVP